MYLLVWECCGPGLALLLIFIRYISLILFLSLLCLYPSTPLSVSQGGLCSSEAEERKWREGGVSPPLECSRLSPHHPDRLQQWPGRDLTKQRSSRHEGQGENTIGFQFQLKMNVIGQCACEFL